MTAASPGLVHAAFFYRTEREYADFLVPFIRAGLDRGDAVLVAVPTKNLALLRDALGEPAAAVTFVDFTAAGRNPRRMLGLEDAFLAKHAGRPARIVGEVMWPGRTVEQYPGCVKHEALVNTVFADRHLLGLCPYDAGGLPEEVLADARTTHPLLWEGGGRVDSGCYAPQAAWDRYNVPLPEDPGAVSYTVRELTDLSPARSFAARYARGLGLSDGRIADLQLIATELATNSVQHADSPCRLAFWQNDGYLVCQAGDRGGLVDPLAGCRRPAFGAGGRGLFLVNAIADLVRTHTGLAGTTIQAYLKLTAESEVNT